MKGIYNFMARCKKITGYTGSLTEITVPTSIGGGLVRQIDENAFKDKGITKITLDTYGDSAPTGAPWGATGATVVYDKEPIPPWEYPVKTGTKLKITQTYSATKTNNKLGVL